MLVYVVYTFDVTEDAAPGVQRNLSSDEDSLAMNRSVCLGSEDRGECHHRLHPVRSRCQSLGRISSLYACEDSASFVGGRAVYSAVRTMGKMTPLKIRRAKQRRNVACLRSLGIGLTAVTKTLTPSFCL